jgi:DNA-binding GntR family transcriptional regulator
MKEKTTIEELFAQYQPDMGDRNEYLEKLSKKLAAAEYAKQYREAQTRRYRRIALEDRARTSHTMKEHREMFDAIMSGNAELAMELTSKHIENAKDHMIGRMYHG